MADDIGDLVIVHPARGHDHQRRRQAGAFERCQRLLLALETFGWLERDGGSRPLWSVSMRPIAVGGRETTMRFCVSRSP